LRPLSSDLRNPGFFRRDQRPLFSRSVFRFRRSTLTRLREFPDAGIADEPFGLRGLEMKRFHVIFMLLMASGPACLGQSTGQPQSPDLSAMEQKIRDLEDRIVSLEGQLRQIKAQGNKPPAAPSPQPAQAQTQAAPAETQAAAAATQGGAGAPTPAEPRLGGA